MLINSINSKRREYLVTTVHTKTSILKEYMELKIWLRRRFANQVKSSILKSFLTLVSTLVVFPPQFFMTLVFVFRHRRYGIKFCSRLSSTGSTVNIWCLSIRFYSGSSSLITKLCLPKSWCCCL